MAAAAQRLIIDELRCIYARKTACTALQTTARWGRCCFAANCHMVVGAEVDAMLWSIMLMLHYIETLNASLQMPV
jgi:hypothetical protein